MGSENEEGGVGGGAAVLEGGGCGCGGGGMEAKRRALGSVHPWLCYGGESTAAYEAFFSREAFTRKDARSLVASCPEHVVLDPSGRYVPALACGGNWVVAQAEIRDEWAGVHSKVAAALSPLRKSAQVGRNMVARRFASGLGARLQG